MTRLDTLDKIHPDLITAFLTTGKCDGIPADVQLFLKQLQWAAEIYEYERNITRAAKQLRQRIKPSSRLMWMNVHVRHAFMRPSITSISTTMCPSRCGSPTMPTSTRILPNYVRLPVTTRPRASAMPPPGVPSPCRRDCRSRP